MMIANLTVLVVIVGLGVYQFLKGTLVKSAMMLVSGICAVIAAFGYYEMLADLLISRDKLAAWAQPLCFVVIFVVVFALMQAIVEQVVNRKIQLSGLLDKAGRVICGILLGYIVAGVTLTAASLSPLSSKYPYPRFEAGRVNVEDARRPLFNPDGFVTGLFGHASSGSLRGKRSFAAVHPNLLNEVFLSRLKDPKAVFSKGEPISAPAKNGVWAAGTLRDSEGQAIVEKGGYTLMFVRVVVAPSAVRGEGLDLAQLRLVCTDENLRENRLAGKGKNVYAIGYSQGAGVLATVSFGEKLAMGGGQSRDGKKTIDFAFYVPQGYLPAAVGYKRDCMVPVSLPVSADEVEAADQPAPQEPVDAEVEVEPGERAEPEPEGESPAAPADGNEQQ